MAGARGRGKLRMKLAADQPGMRRQLDRLAQLLAVGEAGDAQALVLQSLHVLVIDLVAVAVALVDHLRALALARKAPGFEHGALRAQPHRPAGDGLVVAAL